MPCAHTGTRVHSHVGGTCLHHRCGCSARRSRPPAVRLRRRSRRSARPCSLGACACLCVHASVRARVHASKLSARVHASVCPDDPLWDAADADAAAGSTRRSTPWNARSAPSARGSDSRGTHAATKPATCACMQAHTRTRAHAQGGCGARSAVVARTRAPREGEVRACVHARACAHACVPKTCLSACSHARAPAHLLASTPACSHARAGMRACTCGHAHRELRAKELERQRQAALERERKEKEAVCMDKCTDVWVWCVRVCRYVCKHARTQLQGGRRC